MERPWPARLAWVGSRIGVQDLLVFFGYLSLAVVEMGGVAGDPGLGWHLRNGEEILALGAPPAFDTFLHVSRPWVSDQWFGDLLFSLVFRIGSWPLLYAFLTALFLAIYFWILYQPLGQRRGEWLAASAAVLIAFKMGQVHFILRPVVFGFLFFAVLYAKVSAIRELADGPPELAVERIRRERGVLPALFLLWANTHPSFILGLILLWLLPLALGVKIAVVRPESGRFSLVAHLFGLAVLCAAATLINPYGPYLHQSILTLGESDYFMGLHAEWQSPNFQKFEGVLLESALALIALPYLFRCRSAPKLSLFDLGILAFFSHLALQHVRILPFFGIVASRYIVDSFGVFWRCIPAENRFIEPLTRAARSLGRREAASWRGFPILVVIVAGVLLSALGGGVVPLYRGEYGLPSAKYPYRAVASIRDRSNRGCPAVVVAPPEWGGFIAWYGGKGVKPVIDDRNTMIGEAYYREFYSALKPTAAWQDFLRKQGATYLLVRRDSPLGGAIRLNNELHLLQEDDVALLFEVLHPACAAALAPTEGNAENEGA